MEAKNMKNRTLFSGLAWLPWFASVQCYLNGQVSITSVTCALLLFQSGLSAKARDDDSHTPSQLTHRVYSHLLDPREHPDYERRAVKPPDWNTFKNQTQFTTLRGFNVPDDRIIGFKEEIEKFTRTYELGNVIWPSYPILFAKNLGDLADEIKQRDLYLFDIWGYVPGSGPGGYWQQFRPPGDAFTTLESKLGERWFGTDIGEQDGRYIGGYASQMTPASASRCEQYLNFQRHFERMSDDLGHRHAVLVSLNFGHYLLKEGTYTLIGAETAQALPNNQVYYAFIRGAGKQYGVPWFGNASIYNRWGYKTYGAAGDDHGPTKGSSLSLLRRLLYSHILYNSVAVGFENGWFEGERLSPIGRIQQSAHRWVKANGQPGVMHTPVALLLDFYSGWSFPRHLYSSDIYRVWGNRPYEPGDFLTDAVLEMLYPSYQDSSYFHDESGFIAPTPYGDIADCLLSDAPLWLLDRYPIVIAAGELQGGRELKDKLQAYVAHGGHLVLTAGNLSNLPGGIAGHTNITENATVAFGPGRVTFFASPFGVHVDASLKRLRGDIDKPLPKPYSVDPEVRHSLDQILRSQALVEVQGEGLSFITCRKAAGEFTIGIANNTWHQRPFRLISHCGKIESINELPLDPPETVAPGYTPEVISGQLGQSGKDTIAGGDFRIFAVKVVEIGVEEIPHVRPPARPRGRLLPLRRVSLIKEEILARPTFFEHFDGVCVDWRYLHEREKAALQSETAWLKRQDLRIVVDLSSGLDLYPTLRLIDNLHADYESSMADIRDVFAKMEILGAHDLIVSLHRFPENNFSDDQSRAAFTTTLKALTDQAATRGVTLHLRLALGKPPWSLAEALQWLDRVGAPNLKLAASTALLTDHLPPPDLAARLKETLGFWLVAASRRDLSGKLWDAHYPISVQLATFNSQLVSLAPTTPLLLDAVYSTKDEEYLDVGAIANPP
jgi:hypothetical protein